MSLVPVNILFYDGACLNQNFHTNDTLVTVMTWLKEQEDLAKDIANPICPLDLSFTTQK